MSSKRKIILFFLIAFLTGNFSLFAGYLQGRITDQDGTTLPFANIYEKNTSYGVSSDLNGEYFLELKAGKHIIVFSYIGYKSFEKEVIIYKTKATFLNVILKKAPQSLEEVEIISEYKDRSKEILAKVREKRKYYLSQIETYQCKTYTKTSIENKLIKIKASDTIPIKDSSRKKETEDLLVQLKNEKLNLIESVTESYFKAPSTYKEVVIAHHDYVEKKRHIGKTASFGMEYGRNSIVPQQKISKNPYIVYEDISSCDFNFYKNLIDFPALSQKPLLSPIASNSALSYKYEFKGSFIENGKLIYKIGVIPIFRTEILFSGLLFIEDSSWAIKAVDLTIKSPLLNYCKEFRVIQNYKEIEDSKYLPIRREFFYTIRDGKYNILGNTRIDHSHYELNKEFPPKTFTNEIKEYEVDAFDKDSIFWKNQRPITLKKSELKFISKSDSLERYYTSDEYYRKRDSAFNKINFWSLLVGAGHRNRAKGNEFFIDGLLGQINFLGIGGYRHTLPGYFMKEFDNNIILETRGFIDYGFKNEDIKGKIGVGLTYLPKKFVRTFIETGYFYDQINTYSSLEHLFSRSNYIKTKSISIAQRMEIINGLFCEFTFEYSDQDPLKNIQLSEWAKYVFGEIKYANDFERYIKTEIKLKLKYIIGQKYIIKKNKKIILGTDYPELFFAYRKGIFGLFDSEVNFDYLEIGTKSEMKLARFGTSRWNVTAGSFVNRKALRPLEYRYFRGSDLYIFSDPLFSFQLLGPTLNTSTEFFRANYIHHFEGTLLNKVPLINRLGLGIAAGTGTLLIPDENFSHFEMFAGLERNIRIKNELFRLGIYAVTADNSIDDAK
ncbi:MAG: DUF5686 and carboxypeptidase regulatory-like domain-containing protein, partial [Bacteroidota bacterium]|nr:DUF5686 and carboxypeptidase regulatory-like domain-containing protein [Bacteroidota bacterium]